MRSTSAASLPALVLAAVLLAASPGPVDEFEWTSPPPDRMAPSQVDTFTVTIVSPQSAGQWEGIPFCTATGGVTCSLAEEEMDDSYDAGAVSEQALDFRLEVPSGFTLNTEFNVEAGVEFEDDGVPDYSVEDDRDVLVVLAYAWAVGPSGSATSSASRSATNLTRGFSVAKTGAVSPDSATFTCSVVAYPAGLGIADGSCTAPSDLTRFNTTPVTNTVTGIDLPQHGDSVLVELTATSQGDTATTPFAADAVVRINLTGPDLWIRDHAYTLGAGTVAYESTPGTYDLDGIEFFVVGADALGSCTMSGATCEVLYDDGDSPISNSIPGFTYDGGEEQLDIEITGSLSEGAYGAELTLTAFGEGGTTSDSLFFTVWDPTPEVTYVDTSPETSIGFGETETFKFEVSDPGIANGATYDISATWGGSASDVEWSDTTLVLGTTPDTVTVTVTGPVEGHTAGVVRLTATRQGGSETDFAQSATTIESTPVTIALDVDALLQTVLIPLGDTVPVQFSSTLTGVDGTGAMNVDPVLCGVNLSCTLPSTIALSDGVEAQTNLAVTRTSIGVDTLTLKVEVDTLDQVRRDSVMIVVLPDTADVAPLASLERVNPGDRLDRGACLNAAAGAIGIECDDATFGYIVPTVQTMSQGWPLALLYNSGTATGELAVAVELDPHDTIPPMGYEIILREDGVTPTLLAQDTVTLSGTDLDETYRAVIAKRDNIALPTGLYPIIVEVRELMIPNPRTITLYDTVAVVNRYGADVATGWTLSTDEQVIEDATLGKLLWVGADGSYRIYAEEGGIWYSPEPFLGDSITKSGGIYTRHLRGGGAASYSSGGDLSEVTSAAGLAATFHRTSSRLDSMEVPIKGSSSMTGYRLVWSAGQLDSIIPAGLDTVAVTTDYYAGGSLWRLKAPDGIGRITFTYTTDSLLFSVSDENNVTSVISYTGSEAEADPLRKVAQIELKATGETSSFIGYTPSMPSGMDVADPVDALQASINGPRTDTTDIATFWITGWGGVRQTVNPAGYTSTVEFEQPQLDPRRVTRMTDALGLVTTMNYTGNGRLHSVTADGSTTTYTWNTNFEVPKRITGPTGDFQDYVYNSEGLVERIRYGHTGSIAANLDEQITYHTGNPTLVDRVTDGEGIWQEFDYDDNGNLETVTDVIGERSSTVIDLLGRVLSTETAIDTIRSQVVTSTWDPVGRPLTRMTTSDPETADTILVHNFYGPDGRLDSIQRHVDPDPGPYPDANTHVDGYSVLSSYWTYDGFGRVKTKTEGRGQTAETYSYDTAGNLTQVVTPNGHTITMDYDVLGRIKERTVPSVTFPIDSLPSQSTITPLAPLTPAEESCRTECVFPFYPNDGTSYTIPTEVTTYSYSVNGLVSASNADSEIRRYYDSRGRMTTDSLLVRGWAESTSGLADTREWQTYVTSYGYDELNRADTLTYPSQVHADSLDPYIAFAYHDTTGTLATITERDGAVLTYKYDDALRFDTMTVIPDGETMPSTMMGAIYDASGRVSSLVAPGINETRAYTTSGQLRSVGGASAATVRYNDMRRLSSIDYARPTQGTTREDFEYDALGNITMHAVPSDTLLPSGDRYLDSIGRLVQVHRDSSQGYLGLVDAGDLGRFPERLLQWYDAEGNVTWQEFEQQISVFAEGVSEIDTYVKWQHPSVHTITRNYYDALGRLTARQRSRLQYEWVGDMGAEPEDTTWSYPSELDGGWDEYIYDPLGRRVGTRNKARNNSGAGGDPMALDLDGETRLQVAEGEHVGVGPVRKMTWAFWINPKNDPTGALLNIDGGSNGDRGWHVKLSHVSGDYVVQVMMDTPDGNTSILRFGDLAANAWSFVVVEYDGTKATDSERVTGWVNGVEETVTKVGANAWPGAALTHRAEEMIMGQGWDGWMGEAAVIRDAIADSALVNDWYSSGIDFTQPKLVAGYDWDGASGQDPDLVDLTDRSPLGNELEVFNGPAGGTPDTAAYASRGDAGYWDFGGTGSHDLRRSHYTHVAVETPDLMTWAFWVDPDDTQASMDLMGVTTESGADQVWAFRVAEDGTQLVLDLYNDVTDAISSSYYSGLDPDTIQFVFLDYRGNQGTEADRWRVWIDNVSVSPDSTSGTAIPAALSADGDADFEIGGLAADTARYFAGQLGELVIINKILNPATRSDWYTGGIAPDTVAGVVAHYTWHNEVTDRAELNDLTLADGSAAYTAYDYESNFPFTSTAVGICDSLGPCINAATYTVWAGNQILVEERKRLDATTTDSTYFGVVSYTHSRGIDRPDVVWKKTEGGDICALLPSFNWRGQYGGEDHTKLPWDSGACTAPENPGNDRLIYGNTDEPDSPETNWFGSLLTDLAEITGLQYRRARYYDPLTGLFTQIDPIGFSGGLNLYGYANGDPVNFRDPSGLVCEMQGEDRLVCTNIGPGDFETIGDFLGGDAGRRARAVFDALGWSDWDGETCSPKHGFEDFLQCDMLAGSLSHLTLNTDGRCRSLGVGATRRFQAGRFRVEDLPGNQVGWAAKFWPWGVIKIDPILFSSSFRLTRTVAHEARHFQAPWEGNGPFGVLHRRGDAVYQIAEHCAQGA